MNHEITTIEESSIVITPMQIIQQAVAAGADVEKLGQLMALQERYEANEARKAFTVAMGNFKAAKITVKKNKAVSFGTTKYRHATLDNVCDTLSEELEKHGLSFRWKTETIEGGKMRVTCILTHVLGHSESSSMEAMADNSGGKNAIQGLGSVVTYLQRYTALAVTGTATGDLDNDGRVVFDESSLQQALEDIARASNAWELKPMTAELCKQAKSAGNMQAVRAMEQAKDARMRELSSDGKSDPASIKQRLEDALAAAGVPEYEFLTKTNLQSLEDVEEQHVDKAMAWIAKRGISRAATGAAKKTPEPSPGKVTLDWIIRRFEGATDLALLNADAALIAELPESEREAAQEVLDFNVSRIKEELK